jgi:two-component system chemotaxis response regulator CheY
MRILIIDDEFVALTKMMTILSQYGHCTAATNGRQAYEMYCEAIMQNEPFDLITIDLNMPELDGLELLERFRTYEKSAGAASPRKIVVTAEGQPHKVLAANKRHCDAYLVKPVSREVLCNKLEEMGIRSQAAPEKSEDKALATE